MNEEEPGTGKASGDARDSAANERPAKPGPEGRGFPIIGMGASAGGLEAFEQFFRQMPAVSGMAFVLVPHLDPGHASMLTEIWQRRAETSAT
jgi:two-component system CheB/CheR fusion protein